MQNNAELPTGNFWPVPVLFIVSAMGVSLVVLICAVLASGVLLGRARLAAAAFALFLVSSLLVRDFGDLWLGIGWIALFGGFLLAPDKSRTPALYAGVALLAFHLLAIPGSLFWGDGNWESTAAVVLWMAPSLMLLVAGTEAAFAWLVPAWLIHAGLILYAGPTSWSTAAGVLVNSESGSGLSHNPNLAGGFLALGIIYVMTTRYRWLVVPLLPALLFTGSRWALIVTVAVVFLMVVLRAIPSKPLGAAIMVCVITVLAAAMFSPLGYRVATYDSFAAVVHRVNGDVQARMAVPHIPSLLPHGVAEHPGLHNVPLRIAVENGILAAILWLGLTGWALWPRKGLKTEQRQPNPWPAHNNAAMDASERSERFGVSWWMLLALVLLSLLDYYTWMGHLGGFWWLLVGIRLRGRSYKPALSPDDRPRLARAAPAAPPKDPPR